MPVLHYAADFSNQPWYQTLAVKRVPLSVCANWLGIWFVSMTCVVLLLGQVDQSPNEFMALMLAKPHWLMLVATIVLAPLMEEALFRGYLFRAIDNTWLGATGAILLTSIVFTLVHAAQYNLYGMLQIFSLALLLGVARQRTDSLLVPMLIHATQNTLANLVPLLTG